MAIKHKLKEAPFTSLQALLLVLLLLVMAAVLIVHSRNTKPATTTTTSTQQSSAADNWSSLLSTYKCANQNDIPGNLTDSSTGGCVKFAQFLLELGSGQFHKLVDNYDAATKAQVIDFQQNNGLTGSGTVDQATWTKLEGCVSMTATSTTSVWTCKKVIAY